MRIEQLAVPVVQAPLAGGPSTPALAAAVCGAGGLGFVAAGYKAPDAVREDIAGVRARTDRPFGVNLFAPGGAPADPAVVRRYADALEPEAARAGVGLGASRFDDDAYAAKLELLLRERPAVVSFTFGCPRPEVFARLADAGISAWVTVTDPQEAEQAAAAGAAALVVQGVEAGGHRGAFVDREEREDFGLLALLALVSARVELPLVGAGGIATGRSVAAVLAAGASAAAVGTAFMRCPEAATAPAHRAALAAAGRTGLTRAFSGRLARGIVNRLQAEHGAEAPIAYPEVHHLTAPLRARAREAGDSEAINLWAGQAHPLAQELPAAEVVARLMEEAGAASRELRDRLGDETRAASEERRAGPAGGGSGAAPRIERRPVTSGSLASVGYDAVSATLEIEFHASGVYRYHGVPEPVHAALLAADSHGRFFAAEIRDRYPHEKL